MSFFRFFFQLIVLVTLAAGKPIFLPRQGFEAPQVGRSLQLVDITLSSLGNTTVKALIRNTYSQGVRLVKSGSILDSLPTRKVRLTDKNGDAPTFSGAVVEYINTHLSEDGFIYLAPDQAVETVFDAADSYDLTPSTAYSAIADGMMEYSLSNATESFAWFPYTSNTITLTTPATHENTLAARSTLISCTDEYNTVVQDALARAAKMATAAAADARDASTDLFKTYFMTTAQADRESVAARMDAVAAEATSKGKLSYYCQPTADDVCGSNIAAITYPTLDRVVNCNGYYESTVQSDTCGYLDQAAITLHEFTHANAVYSPGTDDIIYGYPAVLSLSSEQALNNADSYAYYASSVYLGCGTATGGDDNTSGDDDSGNGDSGTTGDGNDTGNTDNNGDGDSGSDDNGSDTGSGDSGDTAGNDGGDVGDNNTNGDSGNGNNNDGGSTNTGNDGNSNTGTPNPNDIFSQLPQWLQDFLSRLQNGGFSNRGDNNGASTSNTGSWSWGEAPSHGNGEDFGAGAQDQGGPVVTTTTTITLPVGNMPPPTPVAVSGARGAFPAGGGGDDCDE